MEIEGYEDYLIYEDGRVYSKKSDKFLTESKDSHGYFMVDLYNDKEKKHFLIHRLVAKAYIPNLENKPLIDHINRNKNDNRIENLRWCTYSENRRNCNLRKDNYSGYTGIYKKNDSRCKQGFIWVFSAIVDGKQKSLKSSVDKQKIIEFAIKWKKDNNYEFL